MSLINKILESDRISHEDLAKMLDSSKKTSKKQEILIPFFNKCTMSKVLDFFLDNPEKAIFRPDFIKKCDISDRWLLMNLRTLLSMDMIIEIEIGKKKFYKWNGENPLAKHISELRYMLDNDNDRLEE